MFVDEIAVTANKYEETKESLLARYGDTNCIIQAHLDFLDGLPPAKSATPDELNITFIECHRRIQALRALGEDVSGYGRVLIPKILRAFPPEIFERWIVHVKGQGLSEGDILKLMEFLGEEVDGASQHRKHAERQSIIRTTSHQQRRYTSTLNSQNQGERTKILGVLSVCSVSQRVTGLKIARR